MKEETCRKSGCLEMPSIIASSHKQTPLLYRPPAQAAPIDDIRFLPRTTLPYLPTYLPTFFSKKKKDVSTTPCPDKPPPSLPSSLCVEGSRRHTYLPAYPLQDSDSQTYKACIMHWHVNNGDWQKFTGWDADSGRTGLPRSFENFKPDDEWTSRVE